MTRTRLLLYVDPAWRRPVRHTALLFPYWGNAYDKTRTPSAHALFNRFQFNTAEYGVTEHLHEAEMILFPYPYYFRRFAPDVLEECIQRSRASGTPLLIDGLGDAQEPVRIPNTCILRYGGYRFLRQANEIIVCPPANDLLELSGDRQIVLRQKSDIPSIGFAGWAALSPKQELRAIVKELPTRMHALFDERYRACKKGVFFRKEAIEVLRTSKRVTLHAIVRNSFSAHTNTAEGNQESIQQEMVDNLLQNDYGLDVRGDANASTRLSEILSLGRIPIIIDTERNFPFNDQLDYSRFSLIVDFRDLQRLPDIIADFHAALSPEQFEAMQQRARNAFVQYFRIDALMQHIVREIRMRLAKQTAT